MEGLQQGPALSTSHRSRTVVRCSTELKELNDFAAGVWTLIIVFLTEVAFPGQAVAL